MIRDADGNVGTLFDAEKSGQVETTAPYLAIQDGWTSLQETIWEINDKEEDGCGGDARGPPSFPGLVALDTSLDISLDTSLDTSLPKTSIRCDVADEDVAAGRGCDATYCACPLGKTVDERSLKDGAGPEARAATCPPPPPFHASDTLQHRHPDRRSSWAKRAAAISW